MIPWFAALVFPLFFENNENERKKGLKLRELTAEQRRTAVDAIQLYEQFVEIRDERKVYRGGMHWKKTGSGEYLIRSLDRYGRQQSLGPRSRETEQIYRSFTRRKHELNLRFRSLASEVLRIARFCVAAGVNRVPKIGADIVRLLDTNELLGSYVIVVGSYALYAYEMASGVQLRTGLLQTRDLDALLDARTDLDLAAPVRSLGLIGLLRKVDKTFRLAGPRSFRAVNARGFATELIRAPSNPGAGPFSLGSSRDLIAEQLPGLQWFGALPTMSQIVISENGFPARFVVPDPRVFALHKMWLSLQPTRSPLKRKRDFRQGEAVAQLALDYLNAPFDDVLLSVMPPELTAMVPGLLHRLRSRNAPASKKRFGLPVGFDKD
jgi:hypothetical protein